MAHSPVRQIRKELPKYGRGYREGFPPLILGNGVCTKLLCEVAVREPVRILDLQDAAPVVRLIEQSPLGRLYANNLVRLHAIRRPGRKLPTMMLSFNRELPFSNELRRFIEIMCLENAIPVPESLAELPEQDPTYPDREFDFEEIFGSSRRSLIVLLVSLIGFSDCMTLSRIVSMHSGSEAHSYLDCLVRDGILVCESWGRMQIYSIANLAPWAPVLNNLCRKLAELYPRLQALAEAAVLLRDGGRSPSRKYLRKRPFLHDVQRLLRP
jgi:hypothetical protein